MSSGVEHRSGDAWAADRFQNANLVPRVMQRRAIVIRIDGSARDGLRLIGALRGTMLRRFLEMTGGGKVVLDLSEVSEADAANVQLLAQVADVQCSLVHCPQWLALWIERERQARPKVDV